jgi:hypothetical protein
MKHEAARYVSECDAYQKVKADYIKFGGLLQPLSIPKWKWDDICMDFIVGLPLTAHKFDSIWVIMDRLSKYAQFVPVHTRYDARKYAKIYIAHVLCLHGVPKTIISDRGSQFVAHFWEQLHASLETNWIHSSAYHPQTDDQTECVNQIFEDMLRACVLEHQASWDQNLPWSEFSYNNSYQGSLKMAHSKCYTDIDVIPHKIGLNRERRLSLDLTLLKKLKRPFVVFKITLKSQNHSKRVMQIRGVDHWYLKLEIMCS